MPKTDRRVKRTNKLLSDALIALSQRDGYDAVTIRDITDYADISYSTFFRHFPDKDSLFISVFRGCVEELRSLLEGRATTTEGGTVLFQHVAHNQPLYRVLLGGLNSSAIVQAVQAVMVAQVLHDITFTAEGVIPKEIAANHMAASALALVKWWLDNAMPYPPERMGAIYTLLVINPVMTTH